MNTSLMGVFPRALVLRGRLRQRRHSKSIDFVKFLMLSGMQEKVERQTGSFNNVSDVLRGVYGASLRFPPRKRADACPERRVMSRSPTSVCPDSPEV